MTSASLTSSLLSSYLYYDDILGFFFKKSIDLSGWNLNNDVLHSLVTLTVSVQDGSEKAKPITENGTITRLEKERTHKEHIQNTLKLCDTEGLTLNKLQLLLSKLYWSPFLHTSSSINSLVSTLSTANSTLRSNDNISCKQHDVQHTLNLNLRSCGLVFTPQVVTTLATYCQTNLVQLDISYCQVSYESFEALQNCYKVHSLTAIHCSGLDNIALLRIATWCTFRRNLTYLNLAENADFDDEGIVSLIASCRLLLLHLNV